MSARFFKSTFYRAHAFLAHNKTNHFCDFSDFGAIQLRTDFGALRTWIANNETLKEESRRYLLLVDSIRQCEGVARLLLSRPGDLVDVKPSKNKVAPLGIYTLFYQKFSKKKSPKQKCLIFAKSVL